MEKIFAILISCSYTIMGAAVIASFFLPIDERGPALTLVLVGLSIGILGGVSLIIRLLVVRE